MAESDCTGSGAQGKQSLLSEQEMLGCDSGEHSADAHFYPCCLLIAVLIAPWIPVGPVVFNQKRVGAKRKWLGRQAIWVIQDFTMYKFRSMVQNADPSVHEAYIREFVEGRARASAESGGENSSSLTIPA